MDQRICMNMHRSTSTRVKVQTLKVLRWSLEFERRSDISFVNFRLNFKIPIDKYSLYEALAGEHPESI